jgi:hypothetical protein
MTARTCEREVRDETGGIHAMSLANRGSSARLPKRCGALTGT